MSAPAILAEGVTKTFPRYRAVTPHGTLKSALVEALLPWRRGPRPGEEREVILRDVSFEVRPGETVGVIGRNGSGKSTLLRLVAGIYRPDAGRIAVRGRVAPLIEVGAGFHPELTGRENVLVNGIVLGLTRREVRERFDRIVAFAGMAEHVDAPVRTYSTGMYMRLGFSVALHAAPDVLLVDEVLAVGDEAFQAQCLDALRARIRAGDATTLLVSHDLDLVAGLCGRVLVVGGTRVVAYEDPAAAVSALRREAVA